MALYPSTYHFKAYQNFKAIDAGSYRTIVRFYEDYEREINALDFEPYFEIMVAFVNALFEIGDYERHLAYVDKVIEASIEYNVRYFEGLNIYDNMLFKKAASLFHLHRYEQAQHILRELIRIDPEERIYPLFLKRCLLKDHPRFVRHTRALAILLFLCSAIVIGLELLIIQFFFAEYAAGAVIFRNGLFLGGILLLIGGDGIHLLLTREKVKQFVRNCSQSKKQNQAT